MGTINKALFTTISLNECSESDWLDYTMGKDGSIGLFVPAVITIYCGFPPKFHLFGGERQQSACVGK